jgi:hypothetical protein
MATGEPVEREEGRREGKREVILRSLGVQWNLSLRKPLK